MHSIKERINPTIISNAMDVIVIEHPDGTLRSSPWNVRFGQTSLLNHRGKVITVSINGEAAPLFMRVSSNGLGEFFASQTIKISDHSISYPSILASPVSVKPKDIRKILNPKENTKKKNVKQFSASKIVRNSAVDLDAAFEFEDPDPLPISSVSTSIDLAQSTSTQFDNAIPLSENIPSSLSLQSIRHMIHSGCNDLSFTVSSLLQGPKTVSCHLFLWPSSSHIVVSDIDGTVTKSDVMGQVLPALGVDWSHPGLSELYTRMEEITNCKFIYLSSRPIAEVGLTRKLLNRIENLPEGALITTPDLTIPALNRELIKKRPHEFKIPTLARIKALYPDDSQPFLFGFGNRNTDVVSYKSCGMDETQIILFDKQHHILNVNGKILKESLIELTPVIDDFLCGRRELFQLD